MGFLQAYESDTTGNKKNTTRFKKVTINSLLTIKSPERNILGVFLFVCVCVLKHLPKTSLPKIIIKKNRSTTQEPGLLDENNNRCSSSIQGTEFFYGARWSYMTHFFHTQADRHYPEWELMRLRGRDGWLYKKSRRAHLGHVLSGWLIHIDEIMPAC